VRYQDAEGLTSLRACDHLYDLAAEVPADQTIVEIGVYRGRSLLALAEGALDGNGALVLGIDPFNLTRPSKPKYSSDETYAVAKANVAASRASARIQLLRDFGVSVAERYSSATEGRVGMIYIDADHRKAPVLADFSAWKSHFAPNAVVAFDDCHDDFPGVVEAVHLLWKKGRITKPSMVTERLAVSRLV
jgi:predicted O-methyltransferase YrrM